jgi:subtilisin family serine protease
MRARTWRQVLTFPAASALCLVMAAPAMAGDRPGALPDDRTLPAPVLGSASPQAIPGRYIVVLRKDVANRDLRAARAAARTTGASVAWTYRSALRGFAVTLSPRALATLSRDPRVAYIEADQKVSLVATQSPVTWGLDRIDQRNLPLSNSYTYNATGSGVKAYIIDTGIRFSHNDFGGRAVTGFDAIDGGSADDCNGHGTHVAGTVGGTTYGVAKSVQLVGVRVLNCQGSGTNSQVIAGIDWVTGNHQAGQPAVANMSLGGGASTAIDNAVVNSINDGVTYAIAAGNGNAFGTPQNACNYSPARVAAALTVGATQSNDQRASFSNYGTCLDLFAPGVSITSAWYSSNTATNTISGTSMATPHVAGVAALYLQGNPSASPATVNSAIVNSATTGVVGNPGTGSPNRLLYSLFGTSPPPPPPPPTGCTETFTGTLTGTGDDELEPNGNYWYEDSTGTHRGCLTGPSGTDFDLYLRKWNGSAWVNVAQGIGSTSTENVTYSGTPGYYVWRVYSYSGSGNFTLKITRP